MKNQNQSNKKKTPIKTSEEHLLNGENEYGGSTNRFIAERQQQQYPDLIPHRGMKRSSQTEPIPPLHNVPLPENFHEEVPTRLVLGSPEQQVQQNKNNIGIYKSDRIYGDSVPETELKSETPQQQRPRTAHGCWDPKIKG